MKPVLINSKTGEVSGITLESGDLSAVCKCNSIFRRDPDNGVFYCETCHYPLFVDYPGFAPDFYRTGDGDMVILDLPSALDKLEKLAEYEAAEEAGLLVRLPCDIGTRDCGI